MWAYVECFVKKYCVQSFALYKIIHTYMILIRFVYSALNNTHAFSVVGDDA